MARRAFALSCLAVLALASVGCDTSNSNELTRTEGGTTLVEGKRVSTWSETDSLGIVKRVGVTMDANLVSTPPTEPGTGPLGAVAVLQFPNAAQQTTIFNHFELHWNMTGHEPAPIYGHAHFDLHYYSMTEAQVRAIAPPDSVAPNADRVPANYTYPGVNAAVPQMGVHASPNSDFLPGFMFEKTMILGYWAGNLIFVEPMITKAWLEMKANWSMQMPVPDVIGRGTMYPTRFNASYNGNTNQWDFVYSEFMAKS